VILTFIHLPWSFSPFSARSVLLNLFILWRPVSTQFHGSTLTGTSFSSISEVRTSAIFWSVWSYGIKFRTSRSPSMAWPPYRIS
jgi:hypothetical protein